MNRVELCSEIKGDSGGLEYLSCVVEHSLIVPYLEELERILAVSCKDYLECKRNRDGNEYHITLVNPNELKRIGKDMRGRLEGQLFQFDLLGIGTAASGSNRAFYIVVESIAAQEFRFSLGLTCSDLHITLGFYMTDVHDEIKNKTTLLRS